jgi:hypothetical protein
MGIRGRQHLFLYSLIHSNFNVSASCRRLNIDRKTFTRWVTTDPGFAELLDEVHWHKKNYFEQAFIGLVQRGDTPAILHAARTQLRDRGYGDRLDVSHSGTIQHDHDHRIALEDLDLPLNVRRVILDAVRAQRARLATVAADDTNALRTIA